MFAIFDSLFIRYCIIILFIYSLLHRELHLFIRQLLSQEGHRLLYDTTLYT